MPLVVQELSFLLNNFIRKESLDAEKEKKEREGTIVGFLSEEGFHYCF